MTTRTCPTCRATDVRLVEDVAGDVVVLACTACDATWAAHTD